MGRASAARAEGVAATDMRLYSRIGDFLTAQRLDPEPGNYAFAHAILSDPQGPLARAVEQLTDGGIRLSRSDIQSLGGDVIVSPKDVKARADGLVAMAQMGVESFDDTLNAMRIETQDFGRELAASADAIARTRGTGGADEQGGLIDEVERITAAMAQRVNFAEAQLANATRESADLRSKLEEARDNARRDPLTDLPNRRAFEEAFSAQSAAGTAMCMAVCDVDHFKSVNDRFGHVVGDRVLKSISGALRESCRGHLVARYGGEEFVVLFTGVGIDAARAILDVARATVASKAYKLRETDAPLGQVTFSAGLTGVGPDEVVGTAFHRADRALYDAKGAGRNCIRLAERL
jgi:diguanylate cyclase